MRSFRRRLQPAIAVDAMQLVQRDAPLRLIAAFKLVKAALLLLAAVAAWELLRPDVARALGHWVGIVSQDRRNIVIEALLQRILAVDVRTLRWLGVGSLVYAALFATEGVGLLLGRLWAERLTVVTTAGLVPVELYHIAARPTASRVLVLFLNLAIVAYLVLRLRAEAGTDRRTESEGVRHGNG